MSAIVSNPCFLIVGFGSIGRRHLSNLNKMSPSSKVVVLRTFKKNTSSPVLVEGSHTEISSLDEINPLSIVGAIIATPAPMHLEMAAKLAQLKIPMLIEKPLCSDLEDAQSFRKMGADGSALILIGYNFRFSRAANHVKDSIQRGLLGTALTASIEMGFYLPDWRPSQDYRESVSANKHLGGGALLELSHALDLYLWFFGMPTSLVATLRKISHLQTDVEDCADLILESEREKFMATIHLDMLQRKACRTFKIVGSEGTLSWNMVDNSIQLTKANFEEVLTLSEPEDWNDMYLNELKHFLNCIHEKERPKVTFQDGLDVMKLVAAARQSSRTKAMVTL
jgi:predicted dehydrogenase